VQRFPEPVCVVAAVAKQPLRFRQIIEQRCSAGVVADLARGHEEAQGTPPLIGESMKLRVQTAFGASDQPPKIPFFTRRLDAVRCAFR
jgi:hypothetical protein